MVAARTLLGWVRNLLAIVGALGLAGFATVAFLFLGYQPPPEDAPAAPRLPTLEDARAVGSLGLPLKLISARFSAGHLDEVEVAVRNASTGVYYLVSATNPEPRRPAPVVP